MQIPEEVYLTLWTGLVALEIQDRSDHMSKLVGEAHEWIENLKNQPREWKVGDEIHGFANGYFGRDSYECRRVEAVLGGDTLVLRNTHNTMQTISITDANKINDPDDRSFCERDEGGVCELHSRAWRQ